MLKIRALHGSNINIALANAVLNDDILPHAISFMDKMQKAYTAEGTQNDNIIKAAVARARARAGDATAQPAATADSESDAARAARADVDAARAAVDANPEFALKKVIKAANDAAIPETIQDRVLIMIIVADKNVEDEYAAGENVIQFINLWSKTAFDNSAAGGRGRGRDFRYMMRGGDVNISNTGDLISSVGPPSNYANSAYLSVLQNTPIASPAETTVSENPAYNLSSADSEYIDRPITAGAKLKSKKKDKGLKEKKVKKRSIIYQ